MLKNMIIGVSAVVLGVAAANSAKAECDGIYLAVRGGGANPTIDDDSKGSNRFDIGGTDLMLSGALGYRYEYFRAEVEYIWRDTNEDQKTITIHDADLERDIVSKSKGEFDYTSYMFNVYWDLSPYTWFTPYLNAGIGWSELEYNFSYNNEGGNASDNYKKNRFTWSVGAGLSAKMTNRLNLDLGYRYFDFGKLGDAQLHNHEFYGGVRYVF
ncbi:MAG: porin family protein [Alphaproteobacteria bacterium]|nr:porin family protein [Alphaproteobacteria bacterium]